MLEDPYSCNPHLQLEDGEDLAIINYRLVKRRTKNDLDGSKNASALSARLHG